MDQEGEEVAGARTKKKDGKAKGRFEDFLLYLPGVGRLDETGPELRLMSAASLGLAGAAPPLWRAVGARVQE